VPWGTGPLVVVPAPIVPPRTPREVEACLEACVGCEHERIHDYEAPGCALVAGCCGSQSPLAFKKYVESGAPCRHPAGDRHAAAVCGLHELEAAVKSD